MARIKLIVTGDMEKLALHASLRRFFPTKRDGEEVLWDQPRKERCATDLPLCSGRPPDMRMQKLAQAMLAEAAIGKRGAPADLVMVLDDVELGNRGKEAIIQEHFREAVTRELQSHDERTRQRYIGILRERCSFHLLRPLSEAYFFGGTGALASAGVPAGTTPVLVSTDVEEFESADAAWLPICLAENERRRAKAPWWRHERHPKKYLEHLLGQAIYDETTQGKQALLALDWPRIPKSAAETPMVRCLFEDIAAWFSVPNPLGQGSLFPGFYPPRTARDENRLLRNL